MTEEVTVVVVPRDRFSSVLACAQALHAHPTRALLSDSPSVRRRNG